MLSLLTPIYISINYVTSKKDKFSVSQENVDILYTIYSIKKVYILLKHTVGYDRFKFCTNGLTKIYCITCCLL